MSYSVEDYRLPRGAGTLDRSTLWTWKAWVGWLRPTLLVAVVAGVVHFAVGWLVGLPSPDASFSPYRYLVRWASHPTPPLISPSYDGHMYGSSALWWAIAAQALAALCGGAAGYVVLRRSRRPVVIGVLAGTIVAATHVAFADLWTLHPLGYIGSMGIGVTMPSALADAEIRVYVGTTLQSGLGLVALWAPILVGAAVGALARHPSGAKARTPSGRIVGTS